MHGRIRDEYGTDCKFGDSYGVLSEMMLNAPRLPYTIISIVNIILPKMIAFNDSESVGNIPQHSAKY